LSDGDVNGVVETGLAEGAVEGAREGCGVGAVLEVDTAVVETMEGLCESTETGLASTGGVILVIERSVLQLLPLLLPSLQPMITLMLLVMLLREVSLRLREILFNIELEFAISAAVKLVETDSGNFKRAMLIVVVFISLLLRVGTRAVVDSKVAIGITAINGNLLDISTAEVVLIGVIPNMKLSGW
jgi:hypothetical protein